MSAGINGLSMLLGTWTLERVVVHEDGAVNRLSGVARFSRVGACVVQEEEGILILGGGAPQVRATRRYYWQEEPGRLECSFDDGRPFHTVPLGAVTPETTHLCPPDRYHVRYDFGGWPDWTSVWNVEGPRKSYRMTNAFTPHLG